MRLFLKTLCYSFVVCNLILFPAWAEAATFIPLSLDGDVSYNYGYVTSEGSQSESTGLSTSVNMTGYFWQPWFVTSSLGVTLGLTRAASSGGTENSAVATAGRVGLEVFPLSRFPFSFSFDKSDSRLDYTNDLNISNSNQYTNTRMYMRQSYIGRHSLLADVSWIHNHSESGYDDSTSDALNASLRMKRESNFFQATTSYSTNSSAFSTVEPENYLVTLDHDYVPDTELGVTSSANYINNKTKASGVTSDTKITQASSFFSWRPDHKPYTFSGGVRVSSTTLDSSSAGGNTASTSDFSVNTGMDYRFTTHLRFNGIATFGATDTDASQSLRSTESGSLSYNSDQYLVEGFDYSWNTVGTASNSNDQSDTEKQDRQSVSLSLGHRASRNWALGHTTSMTTGLSQSGFSTATNQHGGTNATDGNDVTWGLSHSANMGLNFRGIRGSTFLALNVSDSRSYNKQKDAAFQMVNGVLSRNYLINRLSSMQGSATIQFSRQEASDADTSSNKSAYATGSYSHSRALGVYALQFNSSVSLQRSFDETDASQDSLDWENRFDYRVGLLNSSLVVRVIKSSGISPTTSVNFRATRRF